MVWPPAGGIGNPHGNPAIGRMIDHFEEYKINPVLWDSHLLQEG
jgi:hypothetical protein